MKFSDIEYQRPDVKILEKEFNKALARFENAKDFDTHIKNMKTIYDIRAKFDTMSSVAAARYSIDTNDEFYKTEQGFFDENGPVYQGWINKFYAALVKSPYRSQIEERFGRHIFTLAEMSVKVFSDAIVPDMQEENHLCTAYNELIASASIEFEGEERNLSELTPFTQSTDRAMRIKANEAKWGFMDSVSGRLDEIYDDLVKVRHRMAVKLGYNNFVEMGYNRMLRSDYDAAMIKRFREQVKEHIVPFAQQQRQKQAERLGLPALKFYDEDLFYKDGNPKPKGSPDWIVENGKKMYRELSKETAEFFDFMLENELMDLVTKKGKSPGGYCTFFVDYKAPFIFSNFNGTSHDVDVLTHEAGHAFQCYQSRNFDLHEYHWPTYEACEIHSMSMEFFTWPWMNLFFEEDVEKYKYEHLVKSLLFIPYGATVDEFQHFVYENPEVTPSERRSKWREIEKTYLPHRDYEGNAYLESGGFWQKQGHIYESPFYYIDYCLAQLCAIQFWKKSNDNREVAFEDYIKLCKAGGSRPFTELVEYANLNSPLINGCVKKAVEDVAEWSNKKAAL